MFSKASLFSRLPEKNEPVSPMRWTRVTAVVVIVSMLSACVSYTPISIQTSADGNVRLSAPIQPGDRVRLVKKDGETSEFRVAVVEEDRISSESITYEFNEIQSMEVVSADSERATLIILIGVVAIGAGFALLNEIEDDLDCAIGDC